MRRRSVQFAPTPTTILTHSNDEYDRTPTEKVNLTFRDVMELMTIRLELNQKYKCEQQQNVPQMV
jgi:hypothetical protein